MGRRRGTSHFQRTKLIVRMISYGNLQGRDGKELHICEICACWLQFRFFGLWYVKETRYEQWKFIHAVMVLGTGYRAMGEIDMVPHRDFCTMRGYEYKRVLHDKRIRSIHAMMQGAYDCTLGTPRSEVAFRILSAQP